MECSSNISFSTRNAFYSPTWYLSHSEYFHHFRLYIKATWKRLIFRYSCGTAWLTIIAFTPILMYFPFYKAINYLSDWFKSLTEILFFYSFCFSSKLSGTIFEDEKEMTCLYLILHDAFRSSPPYLAVSYHLPKYH